jgi:hypothetical protein
MKQGFFGRCLQTGAYLHNQFHARRRKQVDRFIFAAINSKESTNVDDWNHKNLVLFKLLVPELRISVFIGGITRTRR